MDAATTGLHLLFAASQVASADKQFSTTDTNSVASPSRPTTTTDVLPSSISLSIVTDGSDTEETTTSTSASEEADVEDNDDDISTDSAKTIILSPKKKKEMLTFPQILHQILSMTEYQAIVHWLDDGRSFIIEDKRRFALEILPKYFESSLFHSFTRKLNRWGFNRANSRSNFQELMFESKFFIRDDPGLCLRMKCKSREGRGTKKALDAMKKAQEEGVAQNNATPPPPPPFSTFLCRSTQDKQHNNMEMLIRKNQEMINREHQKKLLKERQLIHEQMRYRRKLQIEMERLRVLYSRNEESLTRRIQALESSMMMISGDKWRM
jgi:hypothetical protein